MQDGGELRGEARFGGKIVKQLRKRGWTRDSVAETIVNPHRTAQTTDRRWRPDGTRNDDPATAYINEDGSYVVRNDETGDVVQISDTTKPDWRLLLMDEATAALRAAFPAEALEHGQSVYFRMEDAKRVVAFLESRGWQILGLEGFHSDGRTICPDLDRIADLETAGDSFAAARLILDKWDGDESLLIDFTVEEH